MPRGPKKRDLTLYLLKGQIGDFTDALSDPDSLQVFPLAPDFPYSGVIYVRDARRNTPWWLRFLRDTGVEIGDMFNANTAAVLFLEIDNRRFALTFGYGRNLLALDSVERDFGLRVALNAVDPESLRSVDARTFEELTVTKRTQASRSTTFETFGLNVSQEILQAVTGRPRDPGLGHRITGADAAKLTYVPIIRELGAKCRQLLGAYRGETYKERFAFIDHLREIRDSALITRLNDNLVEKLRRRDVQKIHLAPPDVSDWAEIDSFVFDHQEAEPSADLDVQNYLNTVDGLQELTIDRMKRQKVGVIFGSAAEPHYRWTLFDTVVCETREAGVLYVLTGGSWFRVDADFANQVAADVIQRASEATFLPPAAATEQEAHYNERAASDASVFLFDQKLVRPMGANSDVEFCDLLTSDRKLIHVKRNTRSSTLSHLFGQGVISAEVFYSDSEFRRRLRDKAGSEISAAARELLPTERPNPSEWEVVYAVIADARTEWPASLPFFSQLNFRNSADRLSRLGFNVSIARIPILSQPAPGVDNENPRPV